MKYLVPLLLLSVPAFAESPSAARNLGNPGEYNGSYTLTRDRLGICDPSLRVWSSSGLDGDTFEAWAGPYFFPRVNAGPQSFDNEFERGTKESTYAGNTLSFSRTWYDKIKNQHQRQRIEARFSGDTLRLVSRLWGDPPAERDCTYRRLPNPENL